MISPIEIMKNAYLNNYKGSLTELIIQAEMNSIQQTPTEGIDVADTPQAQEIGLTQGPPRTMAFPNVQGQDFNTMGMDYPIDIQGFDDQGGLVRSYEAVPPGIESIPMGPKVSTVIENPTQYRFGGKVPSKNLSLSQRIENYKKNRDK